MKKSDDLEFEETTITEVTGSSHGYWSVGMASGYHIGVPDVGIRPEVGRPIRLYRKGLGYPVRGIDLDGREVYYRTPEESAEHRRREIERENEERRERYFREGRAKYDAQYLQLPREFKRRIDGFRARKGEEWRIRHEAYELFCCLEAVKIAQALKTTAAVIEYATRPEYGQPGYEEGLKREEETSKRIGISDGHSWNTFGMAKKLAWLWLREKDGLQPEDDELRRQRGVESLIELEHGALCPLVGCEDYGCWQAERGQHG